jgi:hypothetical protein
MKCAAGAKVNCGLTLWPIALSGKTAAQHEYRLAFMVKMFISLYVSQIPLPWTDADLHRLAEEFAEIVSATVRDPPKLDFKAKYGFIDVHRSSADAIVRGIQNKTLLKCTVREPKSELVCQTKAPKPFTVLPATTDRQCGKRGPLPGGMRNIGNAGRGRPRGSKNKRKPKKAGRVGRPTKTHVRVATNRLVMETRMRLHKGVRCVGLPTIFTLKKRFSCGSLKANEIYNIARIALQTP